MITKKDFGWSGPPKPEDLKSVEEYERPIKEGTVWDFIRTDNIHEFTKFVVLFNVKMSEESTEINGWEFRITDLSAFIGSLRVLKYMIINGVEIDENAIEWSIIGGEEQMIGFLSEQNHSFDHKLNTAIINHRNKICYWLMENYEWENPEILPQCVRCFNTEMFLFFIEQKRDINEKDDFELTSLMCAAFRNNIPIAKLILSIDDVDIEAKDEVGKTANDFAKTTEIRGFRI